MDDIDSLRPISQKSIKPDLEKLSFSPEIIEEAERIFTEEYNMITKRGKKRVKFLYSIVMEAHSNLGLHYSPLELLKSFPRLGKTDVLAASSESFDLRTVTRCVIRLETVNYFLEYFSTKLNIRDQYDNLVTYKENLRLPEKMNIYPPNVVALTIISMYSERISIPFFCAKDILLLDGITEQKINKLKTEILGISKKKKEDIDTQLLNYLSIRQ